jgi:death-on-curing family protein
MLPMPETTVKLLTLEHLESAHETVAELFKDEEEPMPAWREGDTAKLETICQCTEVAFFGHQKYPDLHVKASKIFYSAIKLHPFPNGNKRFALMVLLYFLLRNGYELDAEKAGESITPIAKLIASSDPHTRAGSPDNVVELIAQAFLEDAMVPRTDAPEGTGEND